MTGILVVSEAEHSYDLRQIWLTCFLYEVLSVPEVVYSQGALFENGKDAHIFCTVRLLGVVRSFQRVLVKS